MNIKRYSVRGFTLIELVIVIVVIGILTTIVAIAYQGVQNRAHTASLMSDLDNSVSILELDLKQNGSYPATVALAGGGSGLPTNSGTTYQYTVNTSTTSPSFCLTGTNGTTSYKVSSDTATPAVGVCPSGVPPITNLAINPALGSDATSYSGASVTSPARVAIADLSGFSWAYQATTSVDGSRIVTDGGTSTLTIGQPYTALVWAKLSAGLSFGIQATDHTGGTYYGSIKSYGVATGSWQQVNLTFTPTLTTWRVAIRQLGAGVGTEAMTGLILTQGSTTYNYADGNSSGWAWNGTVNDSTSTGPPL